ncbi:unnamed protein product [Adineta steineri]|uniref:Uncharacterized protein n=2 Tax=Adineta steineri TaxID=433720 RepID=A0A814D3H3_9BILA|nr:unnamed protein product [Adineta steineri]
MVHRQHPLRQLQPQPQVQLQQVLFIIALLNPPPIIQWLFDGDFNDVYGTYNGYLVNNSNVTWMSPGYAGYGSTVCFLSTNYLLINHYLNFNSTSFTISAWIWIPANLSLDGNFFVIFSHCNLTTQDTCMHIGINGGRVFLGFYSDDLTGGTSLSSNQWYHVAYVYDQLSLKQIVYLNGIQDGSRVALGSYKGTASVLVVGAIPSFTWGVVMNNGFIDKLTFVSRVKASTELFDEATLVAYYPFDNSYTDPGPNQIINSTTVSTMFDSSGRFNQSLLINSTNLSYFQITGFYYLGQTDYPYSFSLWIYPFVNDGTILQVSSSNGWCVPMIGFDISGRLTIQTMGSNGIYAASLTFDTLSLNQWTHVAMTYSTINGIQLFINGTFMVGNSTVTSYSASGQISTITIGTCLSPSTCAINTTTIIPSQFHGKIDELQIFARELSLSDIGQLAQATSLYTFGPSSFWQFDNNTLDSISNLNGVAVNSPTYVTPGMTGNGLRTPAGPYLGITGAINIGTFLDSANITQPYNGYIDQVSLTMRVKSASEILTDATLTTWHSFDSIPLQDSGPLGLITTTNNVTLATGKVNQALSFNSTSPYYQIQSFVLLGISNHSYSIALWVKRTSTGGGTLVHLSTQTNGLGWCVSLLGFRSTGEIVATNWASSGKEVVGPVLPINVWTHVASTFSTMNGLRFYINGIYSAGTGVMNYGAAQQAVILTLGNPIAGGSCNSMSITTGIYSGYLDEFRVYSRELSVADVYTIANP